MFLTVGMALETAAKTEYTNDGLYLFPDISSEFFSTSG